MTYKEKKRILTSRDGNRARTASELYHQPRVAYASGLLDYCEGPHHLSPNRLPFLLKRDIQRSAAGLQ